MWESMGKVQDTIGRIRARTTGNSAAPSAPPIALLVPGQQAPTDQSFPTAVEAVAQWLDAQPAPSGIAGVHNLTRALQHSNRLENSPQQRLKIVQLFAERAHTAMPYLNSRYLGLDLPLRAEEQQAFNQSIQLLQELSYSYKIILLDVLQRRGQLTRKQRLPVIYQAMKYIGQSLLRSAQIYQNWPNRSWRDLNTLYILAERDQILDAKIADGSITADIQQSTLQKSSISTARSIRQLHSQLCAFSVCNTNQLTTTQIEQLYKTLAEHSPRYEISQTKPDCSTGSIYSVALNSANPPACHRFSLHTESGDLRYFSTEPLRDLDLLSNPLTPDSGNRMLNRERQTLLWKDAAARHTARSIRHRSINAETGFKEVFASVCLTGNKSGSPPLPAANSPDVSDECIDEIDWFAFNPTSNFGSEWTLLNQSNHGMGLRWSGQGNVKVAVGDLLAYCMQHRRSGQVRWLTGVIRWMQLQNDNLTCGIEIIANNAEAVRLQKIMHQPAETKNNSIHQLDGPRAEGLILHGCQNSQNQKLLMVAGQTCKIGETLSLQDNHKLSTVKLIRKINYSSTVQCFALQEITVERASHKLLQVKNS
ncbi:hypothetical protein AB833_16470 [Chromatiales bacterium (ex Bugula neritina AB1)]|nr:hypothetical protein AB833_16470 [Chromatiales bacterium (ex Bugula neritina AB1)]